MMATTTRASRALFWDGHKGAAFFDGTHVELRSPPRIASMAVEQIDYAPLVGQRLVLERGSDWRKLTDAEAEEIDKLLGRMVNTMRQVLCR